MCNCDVITCHGLMGMFLLFYWHSFSLQCPSQVVSIILEFVNIKIILPPGHVVLSYSATKQSIVPCLATVATNPKIN